MKQMIIRTFAFISGVIYLLIGTLQISVSFGIENDVIGKMLIAPDPIRGAALLLIGTVFLAGATEAGRDGYRLVSFTMVAVGLAYLLSLTSLLLLMAGSLEALLITGGELMWRDHIRPGTYLIAIPVIGSILLHQVVRNRENIQEGG